MKRSLPQLLKYLMVSILLCGPAGSGAYGQALRSETNAQQEENEEVVVLEEFSVRTSATDTSIKADETLGALRTSTRLVESPITVSVLKVDFLESFLLDQEHEQSSFIAGGNMLAEWQSGAASISMRGFNTNYYRNGFQRWGYNSTVNVERIEYVKGPLAATFGRSAPGGLVNYITKRAHRKRSGNIFVSTGPDGYQNATVSYTGPLTKNLYYRVDGSYRDFGGPQDFFYQRTYTASSSLTWVIGRDTSLMFDFEHKLQTTNRGSAGLIPAWTGGTFISPVNGVAIAGTVQGGRLTRFSKFNALGPDEYTKRKITTYDLRFEHRFNRVLSLRVNGQYWDGIFERWSWSVPAYRVSTGLLHGRTPLYEHHFPSSLAGQIDLLASFKIGRTSHKLLLTVDGSITEEDIPDWQMPDADYNALPASVRNLDVTNPDWGKFDRPRFTEKVRDDKNCFEDVGFLLSERMEVLQGRVLLYASLRYDDFKASFDNYLLPEQTGQKRVDMFNETYGGVVHIVPDKLLFFVNRSTSFTASTVVDRGTGELQDPPTSKGIEVGFRGEVISAARGSRRGLYWSASIYRIDRKMPQRNPRWSEDELEEGAYESGVPQYLNNGIERAEGIELELFGDLSTNTSFTAAYTKLDAYVKSYPDDSAREGVPLLNVPKTTFSTSVRYKFPQGALRGVSCGATMRYTGEYFARYGTAASQVVGVDAVNGELRLNYGPNNRIEEVYPDVTLFDAFLEYQFRLAKNTHTLGLNLKNLTDKTWHGRTGRLSAGRQLFVRYRVKF